MNQKRRMRKPSQTQAETDGSMFFSEDFELEARRLEYGTYTDRFEVVRNEKN